MGDIQSKGGGQRMTYVERFLRDTYDMMITAEAYSAGACLLTRDIKFARMYGHRLRGRGHTFRYAVGTG